MRRVHPLFDRWTWYFLHLAASATLVAGAVCQPASAQSNAGELSDLSLEQLLSIEVYSASRFVQDSLQAPSSVSVITREDIRTFGYRTVADALESVRGTYLTYDRNYHYLGIRGFSRPGDYNSRFLVLVDGYAVNDGIYNQGPIGLEFPLDMNLVERIEFIPGPGSSLYGSNAFFGVVNVITRNAADVGAEATAYAQSRSGYGVHASLGHKFDSGMEVLLSASHDRSDGGKLTFPEFATVNGGVAEGLDFEDGNKAYARLGYGDFTFSMGASRRIKGIPTAAFETAFNVPGTETEDVYGFADLNFSRRVGERSEIIARASYHYYAYDGDYVYDIPPLTINRDEARAIGWTYEGRVLHELSERLKVIVGAEHQRDGTLKQVNFDVEPYFSYLHDQRSLSVTGLYAQSEYFVRPDLILNAGLRFDKHEGFSGAFSPRFGLIYLLNPGSAVKLLYGRAFRVPNLYERFYSVGGAQKGNPGLDRERIATTQLIYERTNGATRFSSSLYRYRIKGLIDQSTDPADDLMVFINGASATSYGGELELEHGFGSGLILTGNLGLSETRSAGARLDNSPRVVAKALASAPLLDERVRLGLEGLYVGNRDGRGGVSSYSILNLTATAQLGHGAELRASAYNLGDTRYADPGNEGQIQDRIYQDGRTLRLDLLMGF